MRMKEDHMINGQLKQETGLRCAHSDRKPVHSVQELHQPIRATSSAHYEAPGRICFADAQDSVSRSRPRQ
ncbi:hypothetical protein [Paenibacillus taiwanensis]|uniref:hypothetical protein n=1 Tax=Paenibacillus taiwanensis TaxID=401638 RepID=UPI0003FB4D94|nr:hypothetical protein [Paenibacillus taiwanensis]